jgi:hypothetical protein
MMATTEAPVSRWSTSSYGPSVDPSPGELCALHAHLALCQRPRRSVFFLRGAAREFGAFLISRVISTLFIATLLLAGLLQVL